MKHNLLRLTLSLMLSIAATTAAKASHCVGAYLTYEYAGSPNHYTLKLHYYRDCFGIPAPSISTVCYSSLSLGINNTVDLYPLPGTGNVVSFTACSGSSINCAAGLGIEEWIFADTVTLPQAATDWIFGYELCCRSNAITTIVNPTSLGMFVYSSLDNINAPINSSPLFVDSLINQYCVNYFSNINYHCIDADGDSLVYSLVPILDATGFCPLTPITLTYNVPFSATNPLTSATPITLDSATGLFGFTPSMIQVGQVGVQINEFRNGLLIGSVRRDDPVMIVNGVPNPDLIKGKVYNDFNYNNTLDAGDVLKQNTILIEQPDGIYATTNANGDYTIPVNIGNYSLKLASPSKYTTCVPDSNFASFTTLGYTDSLNDFALQLDTSILDLSLSASYLPSNRPCDTLNLNLNLTNVGGNTASGQLSLSMDSTIIIISVNPLPDSISGSNFWWNISNMSPVASQNYVLNYSIDCNATIGSYLNNIATITTTQTDDYLNDNTLNAEINIVNSYDPNIKSVNYDVISPAFVANRDWLIYTIQFQNTGNAPAINIIIKDTIRFTLDAGSFELLGSSHPCTFDLHGSGFVDFNFDNIYLPDSLSNEPASHGYVQYRIKPKVNLPAGQMILNRAYIFFDTNAPIETNMTHTYVVNPTGINQISSSNFNVEVYPNPVSSTITIKLNSATNANFQLLDITGRVLMQKQITNAAIIDMHNFSKGIYFYRVDDSKANSCMGKLIKN